MNEQNRMDELFLKFTDAQWEEMSSEQRLEVLQEMENLVAEEQGRRPMTIHIMKPDDPSASSCNGYFNGEGIYLNPSFFQRRARAIPGISTSKGMQALNTLLHEGRHMWQYCAAFDKNMKVDPKLRALLKVNWRSYCSPKKSVALYACQPLEYDARMFAKERFAALAKRAMANGHKDPCIARQMARNLDVELHWATRLLNDLSVQELLDYEKKALDTMRAAEPDVDLTGISMFTDAIRILKQKRIDIEYVDGKPLNWDEMTVEGVAESLDGRLDAADAVTDPALQGLLRQLQVRREASRDFGDAPDDTRLRLR